MHNLILITLNSCNICVVPVLFLMFSQDWSRLRLPHLCLTLPHSSLQDYAYMHQTGRASTPTYPNGLFLVHPCLPQMHTDQNGHPLQVDLPVKPRWGIPCRDFPPGWGFYWGFLVLGIPFMTLGREKEPSHVGHHSNLSVGNHSSSKLTSVACLMVQVVCLYYLGMFT